MSVKEMSDNKRELNQILDYQNSIFLGNYYGRHDGYDGSVFSIYGICKTITATKGGCWYSCEIWKLKWKVEREDCSDGRFVCMQPNNHLDCKLHNGKGRPRYIKNTKNRKWCCHANLKRIMNFDVDIAMTIMARDYKGFGSGLIPMNGVIENIWNQKN